MSLFTRYDKEGPGVPKNARPKKTFAVFFETLFRNAWKMIPVSLVYSLLFLVPCGFAAVGITGVTRNLCRGRHSFGLSDFFMTIKKNWKQALGMGFLNVILTVLIVLAGRFYFSYAESGGLFFTIALGVSVFLFLYFSVMKFYIWFMVITFDLPAKAIYRNSFKFAVINLKNNVIILLSMVAYWAVMLGLYLLLHTPFALAVISFLAVFFYPTYRYLLIQFGVFESIKKHMIDPYYAEHPDDDIGRRRSLGLDVPDEDESDFSDTI